MSFRFQFRRGTTAERNATNPILAAGEPAVVLDSGQPAELVLGDGVTAMADLRAAVWDDDARLALAGTATQPGDLGTAAAADVADLATAAQGALADTAVQPAALGGFGSEFAALTAALAAGLQSTAVQVIGDSTGVPSFAWVNLTATQLAALYPAYRVEHRLWNATTQDYDAPTVVQAGPLGERYLVGTGHPTDDVIVCMADSAANSITGDIDLRVDVTLDSWTPASEQVFVSKFTTAGNQHTLRFNVSQFYGQKPLLEWSPDGTTFIRVQPSTWTFPAAGARKWLRVTLDVNNGAGGSTAKFYDSTDGVTWTQIGADVVTAGTTSLYDSTADWQVGARGGSVASGQSLSGKVYHVEIRNGIDGPLVAPAKPEAWPIQTGATYGGSPLLTIVNGSQSGASSTYLLDTTRFARMTPDYGQLLTIMSCSHNDQGRTGLSYLADWDTRLAALRAKFPLAGVAVTTQNPRTAPAAWIREHAIRAAQMLGWASRNRVGVVDAHRAFMEDPQGLALLVNPADGVHPVAAGYLVWSESVITAMRPG